MKTPPKLCFSRCAGTVAALWFVLASPIAAPIVRAQAPPSAMRAFGAIQPRLSPDGKTIACSYQGAICTLPIEGGVLTRLTNAPGWDLHPAWSPDGKRIAYFNAPNFGGGSLQVIDATTGKAVRFPQPIRAQAGVWFHPDGARVLSIFQVGDVDRLAWCGVPGGELTPVEGLPRTWAYRFNTVFALSPDGASIYWVEHREQQGEQAGNNGPGSTVWRLPADGAGSPEKAFEWPARIFHFCPAADGRSAFITTDFGSAHHDLWLVPFENADVGARKLTSGQADESTASISGTHDTPLIHTDNADNSTALVKLDPATGERATITIRDVDFRIPPAELRLKITDQGSGSPLVARVSLQQRNGKFFAPIGAQYRLTAGLGHFYARGEATIIVPAGHYDLRIFHGPEYRMAYRELDLPPGASREVTVPVERWVDMAAQGWFSGENHIHANYGYGAWYNTPRPIFDQVEGEDLNVANLVVANSDGNGVFDREFFRGKLDPLSTPRHLLWWNEEFRSTFWGHMTLFHLPQVMEPVFTGFKDTTNPWDIPTNGDVAERTRKVGGAVSYTHPTSNREDSYNAAYAAKGLPVDVALGQIDALDVMGFTYEASIPLWYRVLNCGFRLPAAAGTDVFLNRIPSSPPGWGRVYVRLPEGLTYDAWVRGAKAGRSFVTNGPVLEFEVNGKSMGEVLALDAPGKVRIKARARAQHPLEKFELVLNGAIAGTGTIAENKLEGTLETEVSVERSGWVAVRTSGPAANGWVGATMGAHTNPVWLEVKGHPMDARAEAEYFLGWIDRLEADLKKRDRLPPGGADHVGRHFLIAREVYRRIAAGTFDYKFSTPAQ